LLLSLPRRLATNGGARLNNPTTAKYSIDFDSTLAYIPDLVAVNKSVSGRTFAEFVDWVTSNRRLRYGTSCRRHQPHLLLCRTAPAGAPATI